MFLIIEILFIVLLAMVLFMLYKDELFVRKNNVPHARVEEYWGGAERRKHSRFKKALDIEYVVEKKPHLKNNGKTVDISEGGVKLLLDEKLAKDALVDLKISVPGCSQKVEVEGKVVWTENLKDRGASDKRLFYSGIKFCAIKEPSRSCLIDYMRSIASNIEGWEIEVGKVQRPKNTKLIVSLFSNDTVLIEKVKNRLEKTFGRTDFASALLDFNHTDYYKEEMGGDLRRRLISFARPFPLENIYKIKLMTNQVESGFSERGKRRINIDPGYLDLSKLVLLSTKDYSHRIYLKGGIFAELTLFYKDGCFNACPWTYPDYGSRTYIEIFNSIREIHKKGIGG